MIVILFVDERDGCSEANELYTSLAGVAMANGLNCSDWMVWRSGVEKLI